MIDAPVLNASAVDSDEAIIKIAVRDRRLLLCWVWSVQEFMVMVVVLDKIWTRWVTNFSVMLVFFENNG